MGYHDQVPRASDSCNIEFGSVANLSNDGYFFIPFECLLCYLGDKSGDFVPICYKCHSCEDQVTCYAFVCLACIICDIIPCLCDVGCSGSVRPSLRLLTPRQDLVL